MHDWVSCSHPPKNKKVHRMFQMLCLLQTSKFLIDPLIYPSADEEDLDRPPGVVRVQACPLVEEQMGGVLGIGWASGRNGAGPCASARLWGLWLVGLLGGASESRRGHFLHSTSLSENGAAHGFEYGGNVPVQGGVRRRHGPLSERRERISRYLWDV